MSSSTTSVTPFDPFSAIPPAAGDAVVPSQTSGLPSLADLGLHEIGSIKVFESEGKCPKGSPAAAGPPTRKVQFFPQGQPFEIAGYFHQVIIQNDKRALVLVLDTTCVGYPAVFPVESDIPLGVEIDGRSEMFVVESLGYRFPLNHFDVCVLPIIDAPQDPDSIQVEE